MQTKKRRKMMLALPLLVIPFLTLAFWAMGGGKGTTTYITTPGGLNPSLPGSRQQDDAGLDKLSFYEAADKDSAKLEEMIRTDPYYQRADTTSPFPNELETLTMNSANKFNQTLNPSPFDKTGSKPEDLLLQKLQMLQQSLNNPAPTRSNEKGANPELDQLETMMHSMNKGDAEDPELKLLNGTLEKILDVQHPERMKERKKVSDKKVLTVASTIDSSVIGFYGMNDDKAQPTANAIEAVVHENQILVNGAIIKLRLLNDIFINGQTIPSGTMVYGVAGLVGERLTIEISSIKYKKSLFEVKLEVYDMDGLPGIYIPGAISRDVAKQGLTEGLSLMDLTAADPSIKTQAAAAAGIGTLKNLLSKKTKLTRVQVKAGYKILLTNKN